MTHYADYNGENSQESTLVSTASHRATTPGAPTKTHSTAVNTLASPSVPGIGPGTFAIWQKF